MIRAHASLVRNLKIVTAVNRNDAWTGRLSSPFAIFRQVTRVSLFILINELTMQKETD